MPRVGIDYRLALKATRSVFEFVRLRLGLRIRPTNVTDVSTAKHGIAGFIDATLLRRYEKVHTQGSCPRHTVPAPSFRTVRDRRARVHAFWCHSCVPT